MYKIKYLTTVQHVTLYGLPFINFWRGERSVLPDLVCEENKNEQGLHSMVFTHSRKQHAVAKIDVYNMSTPDTNHCYCPLCVC